MDKYYIIGVLDYDEIFKKTYPYVYSEDDVIPA